MPRKNLNEDLTPSSPPSRRFEDEFDDDLPDDGWLRQDLALPTLYEFEDFTPVQEATDDKKTTESDLQVLQNVMAVTNHALMQVRDIDELKKIAEIQCKCIEVRRRVKKLEWGASILKGSGRTFEIIE